MKLVTFAIALHLLIAFIVRPNRGNQKILHRLRS